MAHRPTTDNFSDSQEAAFRRHCREAVRSGPFFKAERDVFLAVLNHWFHHRNGPKGGIIHPGRVKLAKRAGVCVKTVSRALTMMRESGVLLTVSNARGEGRRATHYKLDVIALFPFCGQEYPETIPGRLVAAHVPPKVPPMSHKRRDTVSHSNSNLSASAIANDCGDAFPPLRLIVGGVA